MLGRFAFVTGCMQAIASAKIENSTGVQQYINLYDDDGYIMDMTYATVREINTDLK